MSDERFQQLAAKAAHEIDGTPEIARIEITQTDFDDGTSLLSHVSPDEMILMDVYTTDTGLIVDTFDMELTLSDAEVDVWLAMLTRGKEARRVMGHGGV